MCAGYGGLGFVWFWGLLQGLCAHIHMWMLVIRISRQLLDGRLCLLHEVFSVMR